MKRRPILLLIIILLVPAMACNLFGGGDDSTETESEVSGEAASVSEVAEEPARAATAGVQDLDSEPEPASEESTAPPTPTLAPTPTGEPVVEATMASSEDQGGEGSGDSGTTSPSGDSGTAAPSGGGSSASGDGWGESGTGAQSACDHPYFPMRIGSTWTWSDGQNTMIWEVLDVQGDLDNATAELRSTIDDVVINYIWNCMAGEGVASFDFGSLGIDQLGTEMTIENQTMEGVFLLPADQLQTGASWDLILDGTFLFTQEAAGQTIEVSGNMLAEQMFTVLSNEPVTFQDQTVDGVQIEDANTIAIVMNVLGTSVDQEMNLYSTYELGRGIGMVRQVFSSDFGTETQSLVSYFIP